MSENQALLAVSILASKGTLAKLHQFLTDYSFTEDKFLVLAIIILFTPELEPASNLTFVEEFISNDISKQNQDAVIELLSQDHSLVELLEVNPELLINRVHRLKSYIYEKCGELGFDQPSLTSFVKSRVRKVSVINPEIHFNDPLFKLVSNSSEFQIWSSTVIIPYEYLQRISRTDLTILQFEKLSSVERLNVLLGAIEVSMVTNIDKSLVSFILASDPNVLIEYLQTYPLKNVRTLQFMNRLISKVFSEYEPKAPLIEQTTSSLYTYPELSTSALDSISEVLGVFHQYSNDEVLVNLIKLCSAARVMNFQDGSLQDLEHVSKDTKSQLSLLHSVLEKVNAETSREFISQLYVLRQTIFTSVPFEEFNGLLIQKLLSLKLYPLITYQESYEDLIVKYFWKCFKKASNGSKHRGEILNASHALQVIPNPSERILSLMGLIDAIDELSEYSLYFKPGTPLVPADFLTVKNVTEVIQRVLELNSEAYLDSDNLLEISNGLTKGLGLEPLDTFQLQTFCIESALVNNDFKFALETAHKLLDKTRDQSKLENTWLTFFQVGKYVSPDWLDTEAPESVIKEQLDLLAKVLKICPVKNTQDIISQWSHLDLELSLR